MNLEKNSTSTSLASSNSDSNQLTLTATTKTTEDLINTRRRLGKFTLSVLFSEKQKKLLQLSEEITTAYRKRLQQILSLTNPKHLFCTDSDIKQCQRTLELAEDAKTFGMQQPQEVSRCQSMVQACVHPTTKEIVPAYGRMAAFTPVNIPICAGMLFAPPRLIHVIGWQWVNQTYNAVFNHCNAAKSGNTHEDGVANTTRDAKNSVTKETKDILRGYVGAVTTSVLLAVGLRQGLNNATRLSPTVKSCLFSILPYTAVACAGMANVGLMRINELSTGLPIRTPEGVYIGNSTVAAKKALIETMISRAVLPIPTLLLPPQLIAIAFRWKFLKSNKFLKGLTELALLSLGVAIGLPVALALYPQDAKLVLTEIEPELKEKAKEIRHSIPRDSDLYGGKEYIIFNKGL